MSTIANVKEALQAKTMQLASLGQLHTSLFNTNLLTVVAAKVGATGLDPHVGKDDQSAIFLYIDGVAGKFPVIHPTGELGEWTPLEMTANQRIIADLRHPPAAN